MSNIRSADPMSTHGQFHLQEIVEMIKLQWSESEREKLVVSWEGGTYVTTEEGKWYEITVVDGSSTYTSWFTIFDGELLNYDGPRLDSEDRIEFFED